MAKAGKTILIILLILGLLVLCCGGVLVGGYVFGSKAVMEAMKPVQDMTVYLCENKATFSQEDYEKYFSENYRNVYTLEAAQSLIQEMFTEDFVCQDIYVDNILDMLKSGQVFGVSTENGVTSGAYTLMVGEKVYVFSLTKNGEDFQIGDVSSVDANSTTGVPSTLPDDVSVE